MKAHRAVPLLLTLCLAASNLQAQDPKGSELRINPRTAGAQGSPDVATAADGSFVVVWVERDTQSEAAFFAMARLFDAAGRPRGGEIRVARLTIPWFWRLAVAMAPDGRFVVVWGSGREGESDVFGRRFAADGSPLGPRFRLARNATRRQEQPDVAIAADGSFVTVWTQAVEGNAEVNTDVYLRRFGPDGRPRGPEAVAIGLHEEDSAPQVAMRPNGDFVVVCQHWIDPYAIVARVFSRAGDPGDEFLVSDGPNQFGRQDDAAVAIAADGRFAVAWTDSGADSARDPSLIGTDSSTGIAVRFYAADGIPLGPGFSVNAFLPGVQSGSAVTALQNGGFLVLWTSGAGQDGDGSGIFARTYAADGTPRGREIRINLNRTGSQQSPAVAVAPNGKGAGAWSGPDGDGTGIFARLIGIPRQGS
ncbi:MAG TPA: hypothetical protein VF756_11050 [Thermoanaerobaculia bacterium]